MTKINNCKSDKLKAASLKRPIKHSSWVQLSENRGKAKVYKLWIIKGLTT